MHAYSTLERQILRRACLSRLNGAELLEDVLEVEVVHSPRKVANVELALVVLGSALRKRRRRQQVQMASRPTGSLEKPRENARTGARGARGAMSRFSRGARTPSLVGAVRGSTRIWRPSTSCAAGWGASRQRRARADARK